MSKNVFINTLEKVTDEAIDFIRSNEPEEGYFVAFSGGKDSIVMLDLVQKAGVKYQAFYSCVGIDPPELVKYIRQNYKEVVFLYPKESFWKSIKKKWPPLRNRRWCCNTLKKEPSLKIPLNNRLVGIRFEESTKRANRPRIDFHIKLKQTLYKPICYWKEWHIWEYIEKNKMPYCKLYDEGFDRIGCVICPFICSENMIKLNKHKNKWPKMYDVFEKVMKEFWEDKIKDFSGGAFEDYLLAWYRGTGDKKKKIEGFNILKLKENNIEKRKTRKDKF